MIVKPKQVLVIDDCASDTSSSINCDTQSNISILISDRLYKHFSASPLPTPSDPSYDYFTLACQNVRGLNDQAKQSQLLNLMLEKNISVLGISETKLSQSSGSHLYRDNPNFHTSWSSHPSHQLSGGVGLLIRKPYSRHIQKIYKWNGRIISADLYFNDFKLKILNVYVPPNHPDYTKERSDTHKKVIELLTSATADNFVCIMMGDLNIDAYKYDQIISTTRGRLPKQYELIEFLEHNNYLDIHASYDDFPLPTYSYTKSHTHSTMYFRLDYIWLSPNFPLEDLTHCALCDSSSFYNSDHYMIMSYFNFTTITHTMSKARLNNKQEKRKIIMHQSISSSQWEQYRNMIDTTLLTVPKFSINSAMNVKWHNLKQLIRAA